MNTTKSLKNIFNKYSDDGSGYGTHFPALKFVFSNFNIKKVFEFGLGLFSTKFFLDLGCELISVEMQDVEWLEKVRKEIRYPDSWKSFYTGVDISNEIMELANNCDLAFVDGHLNSRPECVNEMFKRNIPVIVAHDFECNVYGWERILIPGNYNRILLDSHPVASTATVTTAIFYNPTLLTFNQ